MYEIRRGLGLHFVIRSNSVDDENLTWMSHSAFVKTLHQTALSSEDRVVDLGAHIGTFALVAAREKGCRVTAFEPHHDSFRLAMTNALLNNLGHLVDVRPYAVGGRDGTATLYEAEENWGHTIMAEGGPLNHLSGIEHSVPIISLSTILRDVDKASKVLLKFNIEGAEFEMLTSTSDEALLRVNTLVGEIHHDLVPGDFSDCITKLERLGFQLTLTPESPGREILIGFRPDEGTMDSYEAKPV